MNSGAIAVRLVPVVALVAGLAGCAQNVWDRRQIRCETLTRMEYYAYDAWPLLLTSSIEIDEQCEAKTFGLRGADLFVEDGILYADDVHKIELEIWDPIFGASEGWPVLDVQWPEPSEESRYTGLDFNRVDIRYGPAIDRLYIESEGSGALGYGEYAAGYDDFEPVEADEIRVGCSKCFVNARVNRTIQVEVSGLPENRPCSQLAAETDEGLCTEIPLEDGPLPTHEICIGAETEEVRFRGTSADDNVKIVVLDSTSLTRIALDTPGIVAIVSDDRAYRGPRVGINVDDSFSVPPLDYGPTNIGPGAIEVDFDPATNPSRLVLIREDDPVARAASCQANAPVVTFSDDLAFGEDD